ncbi:methyltransferase domain-containing protein [Enterococcus sp. 669A]|uniref:Methyltransferase domain-containing protein n=1 Tax=Candidatus Enterococcus moelleringii TaxID=2815325 RepID=A0ABS3LGJ2_9ENTE|nr:class I SAM-dependent methyltransferase [Enterococcus sp. 669A]MBO1308750.1 methyltransferase domain-containing protein [Enterococcus sp. 669A]
MLQTALRYSHTLLKEIIQPGDQVIDATMGNGNDTLFLSELVGPEGKVYAFDIQEQALANTKEKLGDAAPQASLFLAGHETIETNVPEDHPIKAAIFNLGYLPNSDKTIITLPETTKQAMDAILKRLTVGGRMILVIYYGHDGGAAEKNEVLNYCGNLPQKSYNVLTYQFINQKNNPPILVCVEKKKGSQE